MKNEFFRRMYLNYVKGCGLGLKGHITALNHFYFWLNNRDLRHLTVSDITDFHDYLKKQKTAKGKSLEKRTVLKYLLYMKDFFDYLCLNDYLLSNPMEEVELVVPKRSKTKVIFTREEMNQFLDCIPIDTADGMRDRALFELMYSSGLRASDILRIELKDLRHDERMLMVKLGKGKKDRYVPFSETALRFMIKYINEGRKVHEATCKDRVKKYLFLKEKYQLYQKYIARRFKMYIEKSGITKAGLAVHSIRHSTGTHLLENGASIRYVQELLGHECINTTQIYTAPTQENIKRIYRKYHPRENDYYMEVESVYLKQVKKLKNDILKMQKECRNAKLHKIG
jgi:site-specific recombinase XerD